MAEKIFTVDKFLGLNESADSSTELKMGEASKIENFNITDDYNLKTRPGLKQAYSAKGHKIKAVWDGLIGASHFLFVVRTGIPGTGDEEKAFVDVIARNESAKQLNVEGTQELPVLAAGEMTFFQHGNKVYLKASHKTYKNLPCFVAFYYDENWKSIVHHAHSDQYMYSPLYLATADPTSGSGEEVERVNIIPSVGDSNYHWHVRLQYSADGTTSVYKLPDAVEFVFTVSVDNSAVTNGTFNREEHTYTFTNAPEKGVNNVEFSVGIQTDELRETAKVFCQMRHSEAYNGATDTRTFFYGNGTNLSYYTGAPAHGEGLYIPVGNELAVDSSASMLTGMRRQGSRLMAFKPDGAFSVDYTTVSLAEGGVTAGFYIYPVHRGIGNDMDNQVQTVGNYARTMCAGSLYEWRYSASYQQDERYAKLISRNVSRTLAKADATKIVTCDDNATQTYYMFLNDNDGTVIVNRYGIDAWTIYKSKVFTNVRFSLSSQNDVLIIRDEGIYTFDPESAFDVSVEDESTVERIACLWESGYMSFGADYLKKHSSNLWISMLPENKSRMEVTVRTDKRDDYLTKVVGQALLDFSDISFVNFSFLTRNAPKIKRIKIKVKKFVYYKLIFRVAMDDATAGDRATVLGYDQQVQYSSAVK